MEHICIVKVSTSYWKDRRALHVKKSITTLRRKSQGYDTLLEDSDMVDVEEIMTRILNLYETKDGLYQVMTCNERRDWETGAIEDYDYQLVPYEENKS